MKKSLVSSIALGAALTLSSAAFAEGNYVFGALGFGTLGDSSNSGALTEDFTTGTGTTIPLGTPLPEGTSVGWDTEFDSGMGFALGYGRYINDNLRVEGEISWSKNDVDTHTDVTAAGLDLTDEDAAVLITGSPALGATVETIVADGRGDVSSISFMGNVFYDFDLDGAFTPYVGAGLGFSMIDVKFNPSGVGIIDDDATQFTWQLMVGGAYEYSETITLYGGYRYRNAGDIEAEVDLFPAELDIEYATNTFEFGVRYAF